ncbi:hypothetical protein B0H16DRAFT_761344 [Mycena metata]|uniref:Uncharacterized protein n=1 Tax=Mycena metata TaxID=1033252 RepID=A0AAD7IZ92_9AGAR|nr:hypothetical protein B0H16DRAFT_761344 [Mycena metata]
MNNFEQLRCRRPCFCLGWQEQSTVLLAFVLKTVFCLPFTGAAQMHPQVAYSGPASQRSPFTPSSLLVWVWPARHSDARR